MVGMVGGKKTITSISEIQVWSIINVDHADLNGGPSNNF